MVRLEKCNDCYDEQTGVTTPEVLNAIAYSADMTYEYPMGMMAASSYVSMVNAHYEEFGNPTEEQMAYVSVKNHGNAMLNPKAQSPMQVTVEEVLNSRIICYPFKLLDCCLYSEASAALILASEEKVKELIVQQLGISENEVVADAKFVDDLGADSLDLVELVMALEDEYGIEIPDEDAEKIVTVGDAIKYIQERI